MKMKINNVEVEFSALVTYLREIPNDKMSLETKRGIIDKAYEEETEKEDKIIKNKRLKATN